MCHLLALLHFQAKTNFPPQSTNPTYIYSSNKIKFPPYLKVDAQKNWHKTNLFLINTLKKY